MANGYLIYIIIGAAVTLFLFLLIVGGIIFFVMKKKKAKKAAEQSTPAIQESQSVSHDLPPAAPAASWDAPSSNAPAWSEPAPQSSASMSSADYSTPSASYESAPSYEPTPSYEPAPVSQTPEQSSPFAAPSPFASEPQPTGPFSSPANTSAPLSPPSYPTSPNMRMETSANMHIEPPAPTPPTAPTPAPSSASSPLADVPVLDETGVTMDLSSYKKYIEEQLKPKSPGSIVFTSGALEGKTYEVPAEGFFIGRDSHASQVVIPDPRVSKSHLWVGWKNGKVTIVDQESRNGTFLNDTASTKITEVEIKDGDTIILGEANVASFEFKAVQS